MNKITIREVAEQAGVGIGTVSRVINNSDHVSEATRARVLSVIDELAYKPNAVARQLPRQMNYQTIGIITRPFDEYYSFAERLRGAQRALQPYENEYELTLYTTRSTKDYDARFMSIIDMSVMDGLLVIDFNLTGEQKSALRQMNIPFVGLNHYLQEDWACIGTDNEYGGYLATRHLLQLGHRRIAYVGNQLIDADGFATSEQRYTGYTKALHEAGIPADKRYMRVGELSHESARTMARDLLQMTDPPTAIFAMSDTQALGCIAAVNAAGLRVPDDMSVIGYDDLELSKLTGLTTVRQHLELSGEIGMRYLLNLVQGVAPATVPDLPELEVIVRETTAAQ